MAKRFISSLLLIYLFSFSNLNSQTFKQFSGELKLFPDEVLQFLNTVNTKNIDEAYYTFASSWDSATFNQSEKQLIVNFSKCYIDKKVRPVPEFVNYLKTINDFIEQNHPRESFDAWLTALADLCSTRKISLSAINRLIDHTDKLLNTNVIFQSASVKWIPVSTKFYYKYKNELRIVFEQTDFVCYAKHDSIAIYNTSGEMSPINMMWFGKNGLVTWERAGFDRTQVSAQLLNYKIDLSKSSYDADSVMFTNKTYFENPLQGHLEDNVTLIANKTSALYPKFESYKKKFKLINLYKNVNYEGGFSMQGAKLIGKGSVDELAVLDFYRKDTLKLKAKSLFFIFRPEKVIGVDASVAIYLERDSIYHGDLQFTYTTKNNEISLIKSENYTAQSPYLNSYHKVDMNFEQLQWRIDEPYILLTTTPGSAIGKANFESLNFFNTIEYLQLQFYDDLNPLVLLRNYAREIGSNRFTAEYFGKYLKRPVQQINTMLFPLSIKGYIFFDASTGVIELKKRLFDNLAASIGKIDYDVLRIKSTTNSPLENATIDLRNNDIKINGIESIALSDSQNVFIFPKDQSILLKRNRNFQFDGVLKAGLFTFFGQNFFFNYDEFKISLKNVDSIQARVIIGRDLYGKPTYKDVQNTLNDLTGDVLIDKPDNKSGVRNNPAYPIFTSKGNSYVYYDAPNIFYGVYSRKKEFYFKVYPYTLDSLNTFSKEGMEFKGEFSSAKIIPVIEEKLILQDDYSLGFHHKSPTEGLPLYEGKGRFFNTLQLSNKGLKGDGSVKYLTSTSKSGEYMLFPDSMNTSAPEFTIEASTSGVEYPSVSANNVNIHWDPYKDRMLIRNKEKPFSMFNRETTLNGSLNLHPQGLTGDGTVDMTTALASSKKFTFGNQTIDADTSNFNLRSLHTDGYAVRTQNVNAHIDFIHRIGKFKSNADTTETTFPENRYIAQLDEFNWKMDMKQLEMISNRQQEASTVGEKYGFKDEPLMGSKYTSIKHNQDSLSFVSPLAIFDYDKNQINAQKVKYIEVADARIFPDKENIIIEAGALLQPLLNAKVMANTESRFHNIYDAEIHVYSKYDYKGKGKYDYIDENNKVETLNLTAISVDTSRQTIAEATITEPDEFTLNPNFKYQGKSALRASQKLLTFKGAVKLVEDCPNYGSSWFNFESPIDPLKVSIPVNEKLYELNGNFINLGTLITNDSIHVYSSFFGTRKNYSDSSITTSKGQLQFINDSSTYIVASNEKIKNLLLPMPLVALNRNTCTHYDEGPVNLGIHCGQMKLLSAGNTTHNLKNNKVNLRIMLAFDFFMYDKSMASMARAIDSLSGNKPPADIKLINFKQRLSYLLDTGKLNKFYDELKVSGKVKELPAELSKSIFLSDVHLVWEQESKSYRSVGKIGVGYINKRQINSYFDGYVELWRKRSGDVVDIYLQIDDKTFYYFGYTRGTMQVLSSDNKGFNDPIRNLKDNDRTFKVPFGQIPYTFLISTERKMNMVKARWLNRSVKQQPEETEQPDNNEEKKAEPENNETPKDGK